MPNDLVTLHAAPTPPCAQHFDLRATAYNSREQTLRHLQALLRTCRGFFLDDSPAAAFHSSLKFEVPRHSILDLYSGLLAADLDLSRDSHLRLSSLCTLRRYHPLRGGNVSLRLDLTFFDTDAVDGASEYLWPASGLA